MTKATSMPAFPASRRGEPLRGPSVTVVGKIVKGPLRRLARDVLGRFAIAYELVPPYTTE